MPFGFPTGATPPTTDSTMNIPAIKTNRAIVRARRDQRLRRLTRALLGLPGTRHLDRPQFAPLVRSYCILTLKIADANDAMRDRSILNEHGELRSSLDFLQRLISSQMKLARELCLTPATARSMGREQQRRDLAEALGGGIEVEVMDRD